MNNSFYSLIYFVIYYRKKKDMEKSIEEKHSLGTVSASGQQVKEACSSDVPADEIEDNRDVEIDSESSSDSSSSSDSNSDSEYECDICDKAFSSYLPFKQHLKGKKHAKAVLRKKKEHKLAKIETTESEEEHFIQEPYAECKICKKEFGGPEAYVQHLKCKKHKQKVLEASILEQVQEEGKINADKLRDLCRNKRTTDSVLEDAKEKITSLTLEDEDGKKEEEFECKECEKIFSGLIPYTQHLTSKTHSKKVEKKNLLHKVAPGTSKEDENSKVNTLCTEDDVLVCKVCSTSFSGPENAVTHMKSKKHAKNVEKYVRRLERKKEKKQSKDTTDFNLGKGNKVKPEHESHAETTEEKLQPNPDGSGSSEVPKSSKNSTVNASTSSNRVNEGLIAHQKYKEYKEIMNSLQEYEIMK